MIGKKVELLFFKFVFILNILKYIEIEFRKEGISSELLFFVSFLFYNNFENFIMDVFFLDFLDGFSDYIE